MKLTRPGLSLAYVHIQNLRREEMLAAYGVVGFMDDSDDAEMEEVEEGVLVWPPPMHATGTGAPVFIAARAGDAERVLRLVDADTTLLQATEPASDQTLLMLASEMGQDGLAASLLTRGADARTAGRRHGRTALHYAAKGEAGEGLVELLLRSGAEGGRGDVWGCTPLMCASRGGRGGVVKALLQVVSREVVDSRDEEDTTALMGACRGGHVEVARLLLLAGADHTIRDVKGRSARDLVGGVRGQECARLLEWWEGERERPYAIHRGRHLDEKEGAKAIGELSRVPLTPSKRARGKGGKGQVETAEEGEGEKGETGEETRAIQTTEREEHHAMPKTEGDCVAAHYEAVKVEEEEMGATVGYVMGELPDDLYAELMAAFHDIRQG